MSYLNFGMFARFFGLFTIMIMIHRVEELGIQEQSISMCGRAGERGVKILKMLPVFKKILFAGHHPSSCMRCIRVDVTSVALKRESSSQG